MFFLIFTLLIPCKGAIVTPSVTIAKPTLTAKSNLSSSLAFEGRYFPKAISFEKIRADNSFPFVFSNSRRGSAISMSCILATLSAKSNAIFGSTIAEESTNVDFAAAAFSKISNVFFEISL